MEYQTPEQFKEIYGLVQTAQYSRAAERCVEYRFFHQDLRETYESLAEEGEFGINETTENAWSLGALAELAQTIRGLSDLESEKG